jgi:hypothetical protein
MKKLLALAAFGATFCAAVYIPYVLTRPEKIIGLGEQIRHDDFFYSVTGVKKSKTIGEEDQRVTAQGTFYIVSLKVENKAVRVDHRWDISMAHIEDEAGRKYHPFAEGQEAWDEMLGAKNAARHTTPAGASETADIVFDLPADVKNPGLKIWKDVLMGDVLDGVAYRKVKVAL